MIHYPEINPVIFGNPFDLRWYSLMYVLGLLVMYIYLRRKTKEGSIRASLDDVEWTLIVCLLGMMGGARLFYVLFYDPSHFIANPGKILAFREGGLSFHGAMFGVVFAGLAFCRWRGVPFFNFMDHVAVAIPAGLGLGRIGNFINGELWGRTTDLPWGMVFPGAGPLPRHPSQLYEAVGEGPILWLIMAFLLSRKFRTGTVCASFLIMYSIIRYGIEFVREPDEQLGFVLGFQSMGQVLSLVMALLGVFTLWYLHKVPLTEGVSQSNGDSIGHVKRHGRRRQSKKR